MPWMIWPDNPALSGVALFAIAVVLLYGARQPLHDAIHAIFRAVFGGLRLAARSLAIAARELGERNRVVLLARGREDVTQTIEREFDRVAILVRRDLEGYPALQRRLMDEITRIEEDYKKCGEVPPPPPEWTKAVAVIAKLKNSDDGLIEKILTDISVSVDQIYDKVVAEYRRSYQQRHKILGGFQPFWRSLNQTLTRVDRNIIGLHESAAKIDGQIEKYREITARSEKVEQALISSATTQFVIAACVIAIAFGGAFVNFWLIARPMAAMVGGGQYVFGDLEASHVAALVIILVEAAMGLFLMEALRVTHLFPRIQNMNDRMRRTLTYIFFSILFILAGVEVALAVMRDMIITADIDLKRGLGGIDVTPVAAHASWVTNIPVAGQMILGFVLPFALAFVAIPFEYFIHSGRSVLGVALARMVHVIALTVRIAANIARHVGVTLIYLYDAVIFLPLLIERAVQGKASGGDARGRARRAEASTETDHYRKAG